MRFFTAASALMALATSAFAQTADFDPVYSPQQDQVVQAGQPFQVTWSAPAKYQSGTISISLIGGADQNSLEPVGTIATGIANSQGSYTWNVDAALGDKATYGLVFKYESDTSIYQYSMRFKIQGGAPKSSSTAVAPTTSAPGAVVTTATGVKTVTLTSCPPTVTSAPSNGTATWTTKVQSQTAPWNNTGVAPTTIKPTGQLPTTVVPTGTGKPTGPPTSGALRFGASTVAIFGGVAAALFL